MVNTRIQIGNSLGSIGSLLDLDSRNAIVDNSTNDTLMRSIITCIKMIYIINTFDKDQ